MHFLPYLSVQTTFELGSSLQSDIFELAANAGLVVKFVLLLLLVFSVICWAVIFMKFWSFRKVRMENEIFLEAFWEGNGLSHVFRESRHLKNSPLAAQFRSGYIEFSKFQKSGSGQDNPHAHTITKQVIEHMMRTLDRTTIAEVGRMGRKLSFLATTGNSAPFIGLFGTVWGIMNSFRNIGLKGAANLAVVAPGIAEALIATAAGLAAAIPAVIFYNYFSNKVAQYEAEMNGFSSDFINTVEME